MVTRGGSLITKKLICGVSRILLIWERFLWVWTLWWGVLLCPMQRRLRRSRFHAVFARHTTMVMGSEAGQEDEKIEEGFDLRWLWCWTCIESHAASSWSTGPEISDSGYGVNHSSSLRSWTLRWVWPYVKRLGKAAWDGVMCSLGCFTWSD